MQPPWLRDPPAHWGPGSLDREAFYAAGATLQALPGFNEAARGFARDMVLTFQRHPAVRRLLRNEASLAFCAFVLMLHHRRDRAHPASGASYARLVELFGIGGLGSRAIVKQQLALQRLRGHLETSPDSGAGRRIVQPTARFMHTLSIWFETNLRAVQRLVPMAETAAEIAARPDAVSELLSCGVTAYARDGFVLSERYPEVRLFMEREQGYVLLMALIASLRSEPGADGQPRYLASVPLHPLAEQLDVARATLRNLLTQALRRQWLLHLGRGGHEIEVAPAFAQRCREWMALEFVWMAGMAPWAAACSRPDRWR